MLCQSAPINPKNDAGCDATVSDIAWRQLTDGRSCNVVERRAGPVSPYSHPKSPRPPAQPSRRLRPRLSDRTAQQRSSPGDSLSTELRTADAIRLRDPEKGRPGSDTQPDSAPSARVSASASTTRGSRRGRYSPSRRRESDVPRTAGGIDPAATSRAAPGHPDAGPAPDSNRPSMSARAALWLLHGYQRAISPSLGTLCRYEPTCSHYACEAIERYGFMRGSWLAIRRLSRCTPLGGRGYDPVPESQRP